MPTFIRFLMTVILLAGLSAGAFFALGTLVEPTERDLTIRIPSSRINP
ncbi:MAG: histidine kinase [Pseudomonadota bacterium]